MVSGLLSRKTKLTIEKTVEKKLASSFVFQDALQTFYEIRHEFPINILGKTLPAHYVLIKSYLNERLFILKTVNEYSELKEIKAGVLHGTFPGLLPYLLHSKDNPGIQIIIVATFVDDTLLQTSSKYGSSVSRIFKSHIIVDNKIFIDKQEHKPT